MCHGWYSIAFYINFHDHNFKVKIKSSIHRNTLNKKNSNKSYLKPCDGFQQLKNITSYKSPMQKPWTNFSTLDLV